jgi:PhnB protein
MVTMAVSYIPDGFSTVTPYLVVRDAAALIEFLKRTFDAEELDRTLRPNGSIMNAIVRVGTSHIMMGEAVGDTPAKPAMLYVYVPDVDATYRRALDAGATSISELADMFYGDRHCGVQDAHGNQWWIATHKEDMTPEEAQRRASIHRTA